jgi:GT2 family glycosyltransferase
MSGPFVYSAVLNWNNFDDADECLASLLAQTHGNHKVALVDNGSTDGSLGRLQEKWEGRVEFVENRENLGVAEGYNVCIRTGLAAGADYVITYNNDLVADPRFVERVAAEMEGRPDAAAAIPIILYYDRPDLIWFAGASIDPWFGFTRQLWQGRSLREASGLLGRTVHSDWIVTCATVYSRKAVASVGLMDDRLFFGHDDVDWCLRARARGFRLLVVGEPLVRHKVGVSSGSRGSSSITARSGYHQAAGSVLVGAKHYRGVRRLTFLLGLLFARAPYHVWTALREGSPAAAAAFLRGLAHGLGRYML